MTAIRATGLRNGERRGHSGRVHGLFRLVALAMLCFLMPAMAPVMARPLDAAEQAALSKALADFDKAIRTSDYDQAIAAMPPRILENFAKDAGKSVAELRKAIVAGMSKSMADVKIREFKLDLSKAEHHTLPDGEPYLLIPTTAVIKIANLPGKVQQNSQTLAFRDGGKWYLLRLESKKRAATLKEAYPAFAGIKLAEGTMQVMPE